MNCSSETNRTQNGAISYKETSSKVLDFFSKSGALRGKKQEALMLFEEAFIENKTLALKSLFYMRDVRGGQGERDVFRAILEYLSKNFPAEISRNMKYIPEFGRWDDLYSFIGSNLQDLALDLMKKQFFKDKRSLKNKDKNISLLAKWLKSENTSSSESKKLAKITREHFKLSSREYRKSLSLLRNKIFIVESEMSQNKWAEIEYDKVPSQASRIYSNAFKRHDSIRYSQYIEKVHSGEKKINSRTLYPYDIVKKVKNMNSYMIDKIQIYDALWKSLPNFASELENSIAVVDTSDSMNYGLGNVAPIDVALSLGIYFAERNNGPFKNCFITFSKKPKIQKIKGSNIFEKVVNLSKAHWEENTNFQAVFELLLKTAIDNNVPQEDLPKKIYIISDMQFDKVIETDCLFKDEQIKEKTNFEAINEKYKKAGYKRPQLVFWNVNASSDTPVTKDDSGTFLVSGYSPSIFKHAINCIATTPYELMLEVLNSDRYSMIT